MIADGNPFVVGQERLVGAEELADVCGVVDGSVEVGVVEDCDGFEEVGLRSWNQYWFDDVALGVISEQADQSCAKRTPRFATAAHQRVQIWRKAGGRDLFTQFRKKAGVAEAMKIENEATDGYAEVCGFSAGEGAVGKALQREADSRVVGGVDPGLLSPKVRLRLQSLTSGAEARSIRIVSMARLMLCPFRENCRSFGFASG